MRSKPICDFFQSNDALAHLQEHASRLMRLQRAYEEFAPANLSRSSWIANLKAGMVVIHAENGAVAAKLKQLVPRLVGDFLTRGLEVTGIEVRLQAGRFRPAAPVYRPRPVSAPAREALARLEASLPDDSPLRRVLGGFRA